jgi:hypothetical protein
MGDWQPIETAPEHKSVIVYAPWPDGQPFRGEAFRDWNGVWRWADKNPIEPRNTPTHWVPFPEPPVSHIQK